jgi:hypothetical protein
VTEVLAAVARIRRWGEERDWRGYDPYDGLNSPFAAFLSLGTPMGRRLVTQTVKRSPLNLRPPLRIPQAQNAKAVALVASAYSRLWAATGDEAARIAAERWLDWLVAHPAEGTKFAWGYHFPVQTRVFAYPRNAPNTIATAFVADALFEGADLLGEARWEETAQAAAEFLLEEFHVDGDRPFFRYLHGQDELIHNANALACATLVRAGFAEPAARALETTLDAQREDGSWPYAAGPHDWVDNFHTAYVLESVARCLAVLPDARRPLGRGVEFWNHELFLADGTPKYDTRRTYPLDAHCYATAIDTWLALGDVERASDTARLLVDEFLDESGYVLFQKTRYWTNRVPFVRWTTAPSFRALAGLQLARVRVPQPVSGLAR